MAFTLGPQAQGAGYRLASFETIGSTNAEALARGTSGDAGRLWVVSRQQTSGRGRRGRAWQTVSGNLAASLLQVSSATVWTPTLGFAAGLALVDALRRCEPALAPGLLLKWPNDVLLNGAKMAGILLESVGLTNGAAGIVLGIGVNVVEAPQGLAYPATSLADHGVALSAEQIFAALADSWVAYERLWDEGRGFDRIRAAWLDLAAGLGHAMTVNLGGSALDGVFETIDEEGRLVLKTADGSRRTVAAGDVQFGAAATARNQDAV